MAADGLLTFARTTTVYLADVGLAPGTTYSYEIVNGGTTAIAFNGGAFNAADLPIVANFTPFGSPTLSQVNNTLVVNLTTVSEPGSLLLMGLGAGLLSLARRRTSPRAGRRWRSPFPRRKPRRTNAALPGSGPRDPPRDRLRRGRFPLRAR